MSSRIERKQVASLCVDVARSTSTGLSLRPNQRSEFQYSIIDVMGIYQPRLGFHEVTRKFTGDGWILLSPNELDWIVFVLLAKTLCSRYQSDAQERMRNPPKELPGIRACICTGYDMKTSISNLDGTESIDWLGDSVRRASRFADCPAENTLYVDQTIKDVIELEFEVSEVDVDALPTDRKPKKNEEKRPLWMVGDVKPDVVDDADDPTPYLHFLNWTNRSDKTEEVVSRISETFSDQRADVEEEVQSEEKRQAAVKKLRHGLPAAPTKKLRESLIQSLVGFGAPPDSTFFNIQMRDSVSYQDAEQWYESMAVAGTEADVVTFSTLINRSPDYEAACGWYAEMQAARVAPNEVTSVTLVKMAPDFLAAQTLTERLREDGGFRGQAFYAAVFAKVTYDTEPIALIDWYFQQDYRHPPSIEPVIGIYRRAHRMDAAMEFVVRWAQLPASQKFIRENVGVFTTEIDRFLGDPNTVSSAWYALGLFYFIHERGRDARIALKEALKFDVSDGRRRDIEHKLRQLGDL